MARWSDLSSIISNENNQILLESYSTRPIWWHYLCVTVPNKITRPNSGYMLIDQGSNNDR